ncbi:NAD-dependent epimerase/dehydratase family protein [Streptacidiphilus anmyonensis]|uniref:NAD-dependent epimerase/dehydratase family protein n=1 Tax=Streptacidiphilus anmyonensis TaxID=405782 RepID=UPI0005A71F21|nr:NAD(P)-dependent oxidoreductase [Streptacidiphilus anmyonensis]
MSLESLSGKTVLVTGAGGLVGSRITAKLRDLGARPISVCKLDAYPPTVYSQQFGIDTGGPDFVVGDISEPGLMEGLLAGCDYVVHAAALADVAACTRRPIDAIGNNIVGTERVLEAAAASSSVRRLVFVSSASVYGNGTSGDAGPGLFTEGAAVRPLSVYGNTKVWGEYQTAAVLGAAGTSYAVVRYFSVYGEPQVVKQDSHSWVVAWFAMRAALGLPLHLNGGGHQVRDFVHVDDVAAGTLRALVAPQAHNQTVNIGTGTGTLIRQIAELIRIRYPEAALVDTPMPVGDPEGGYADISRMEQVLGWRPGISVVEGVRRYTSWLDRTPEAIPAWMRDERAA